MSTIYDVAKQVGVSTATVSRAMNGVNSRVAHHTRRRILEAVEALGYTPNSAAANLRTLRSSRLLVTVPDISNPFFAPILRGIDEAAHREGYAVLLGDLQDDARRDERYGMMLNGKHADGLICLGHQWPKHADQLVRAAAPRAAVIVHGCESHPPSGVASVHIDNHRAAFDAMDHLYALGHRRIGVLTGPQSHPLSRIRLRGTLTRARQADATPELAIVHGEFSIEAGRLSALRLLDKPKPPTAMFCFNDEIAMGAIAAARSHGRHVPDDLSIVGFDDIRYASQFDPPLTTIAQPTRDIGKKCVKLLLDIVRGTNETPASIVLPHELIVRSTSAPLGRQRR